MTICDYERFLMLIINFFAFLNVFVRVFVLILICNTGMMCEEEKPYSSDNKDQKFLQVIRKMTYYGKGLRCPSPF